MGNKRGLILTILIGFALVMTAANKRFTLVIDAGHGGNDAGAIGSFSKEKTINLKVALAFGQYVERNCPDVRIIYTRRTDVFVPLHERANIANRNKADLFVSIHTNALPGGKTARGLETYTLGMHRAADNLDVAKRENSVILVEKDYKQHYEGFDPNSAESYIMFEFLQDRNMAKSVDMARFVQKRVCATANRPDKGVKQAGFLVLRETSMPSCLIELGFITTSDEERLLNSESGVDNLAKGIYQAFADYKNKYDKGFTVPYQAEKNEEVTIPTIVPEESKPKKASKRNKEKNNNVMEELANARKAAEEEPNNAADTSERKDNEKAKDEGKTAETPVPKPQPEQTAEKPQQASDTEEPVFKVQIITSARNLRPGSQQFKGVTDVECYQENGLYKYTCGKSTNYNEIYRLRKSLLDKFPEAFIIAFKQGSRTDVVQAIREFKQNRTKK